MQGTSYCPVIRSASNRINNNTINDSTSTDHSLLEELIPCDLIFANLVFLLIDLPGFKILLHPIFLTLQIIFIAAACRSCPKDPTEQAAPHCS